MTTLLLIRHGQSHSNLEGKFAGFTDTPLTETGLRQAERTAAFIAQNYKVHAVYASDLQRAHVTGATVAAALKLPVHPQPQLREIFAGSWEGNFYADLANAHSPAYETWLHDIGNCQCPGGESVAQLSRRVYDAVRAIAEEHDGKTVAIATHATPIRTLLCRMEGKMLSEMKDVPWVTNASVTEVHYKDGSWTLAKISQDAHLGDLITRLPKNA